MTWKAPVSEPVEGPHQVLRLQFLSCSHYLGQVATSGDTVSGEAWHSWWQNILTDVCMLAAADPVDIVERRKCETGPAMYYVHYIERMPPANNELVQYAVWTVQNPGLPCLLLGL
jgi:hypothetical protein